MGLFAAFYKSENIERNRLISARKISDARTDFSKDFIRAQKARLALWNTNARLIESSIAEELK